VWVEGLGLRTRPRSPLALFLTLSGSAVQLSVLLVTLIGAKPVGLVKLARPILSAWSAAWSPSAAVALNTGSVFGCSTVEAAAEAASSMTVILS